MNPAPRLEHHVYHPHSPPQKLMWSKSQSCKQVSKQVSHMLMTLFLTFQSYFTEPFPRSNTRGTDSTFLVSYNIRIKYRRRGCRCCRCCRCCGCEILFLRTDWKKMQADSPWIRAENPERSRATESHILELRCWMERKRGGENSGW